jgi:hypothetical protein
MSIDKTTMWNLFQQLALMGPAIFLERLVPKEKLELEYLRFTRQNARNYFLLKLLTEVQKAGFVFLRWNDFLEKNKLESSKNADAQIWETLIDEQSLWQRKLMEGLVFLINFSLTNELPFYYHFLLLRELDRYHNMLMEQEDFFCRGSALTQKTVTLLTQRIQTIEGEIGNLSRCWYRSKTEPPRKRKQYRSGLSTLRQQMKSALSIALSSEKTALGYTYGLSYAETSGNIHFNVTRLDLTDLPSRFSFGFAQCGQLALRIIQRAHDLAGLEPEGVNKVLMRQDRNRPSNTAPTQKRLQKGDFVLANGPYLGEVVEITTNTFGYESYQVKYLDETPLEGIHEDWFPSFEVQPFMKRADMIRDARDALQNRSRESGVPTPEFSEPEIYESTRDAVIEMWRKGIRKYVERTMVPNRKGDTGMGFDPLRGDA